MEPESLMSYMSFVFQDVTLFNDTVMNNIRIGNPNATDEQVITAAQAAIVMNLSVKCRRDTKHF